MCLVYSWRRKLKLHTCNECLGKKTEGNIYIYIDVIMKFDLIRKSFKPLNTTISVNCAFQTDFTVVIFTQRSITYQEDIS